SANPDCCIHHEYFNAKRSLNIFKRRQYFIEYKTGEETKEFIHLLDKKSFDVVINLVYLQWRNIHFEKTSH
ncbi:hypothetical protein R0J90_23790, partial [Micrococcus sp. SIMBA_144]